MDNTELQLEEDEVLRSIYEDDERFKKISDQRFSYMFGQEGSPKSFIVHITWTENYPEALPEFDLDAFYNNHLNFNQKKFIIDRLKQESEEWIGSALTYTIFEWIKENLDELVVIDECKQHELEQPSGEAKTSGTSSGTGKEKKENLTKQQKRRLADRGFLNDERPRGWNWVDIVKLSKSGNQSG